MKQPRNASGLRRVAAKLPDLCLKLGCKLSTLIRTTPEICLQILIRRVFRSRLKAPLTVPTCFNEIVKTRYDFLTIDCHLTLLPIYFGVVIRIAASKKVQAECREWKSTSPMVLEPRR